MSGINGDHPEIERYAETEPAPAPSWAAWPVLAKRVALDPKTLKMWGLTLMAFAGGAWFLGSFALGFRVAQLVVFVYLVAVVAISFMGWRRMVNGGRVEGFLREMADDPLLQWISRRKTES